MKKIILALFGVALIFVSCDELENTGLSDEDIVEGLKTALTIGTDSSSKALSVVNGYYGDALVKIPLPEEAELIRNKINGNSTLASISGVVGLDDKFETVIMAVNRAAEDAAKDAAPIFKEAITDLDITQGLQILNGQVPSGTKSGDFDSTAATQYLSIKTYDPLVGKFAPKINVSLGKNLVGNVSALDAWSALTSTYNNFVGRTDVKTAITIANIAGQNINLPGAINSDLGEFSTQKALDGLFLKVGHTEKKIRRDPFQWASDILQKVFGRK